MFHSIVHIFPCHRWLQARIIIGLLHLCRRGSQLADLIPPLQGHDEVQSARDDQAERDDDHCEVCHGEGKDVQRVISDGVEVWVRERDDDGEDGSGDVF